MYVPIAAVDLLLENLSLLCIHKYSLIADVNDNINRLQRELINVKALMADFGELDSDSDFVKPLVQDIRKILDEAEDAVDTYVLQASVQKSRRWVSKAFHQILDYPVVLRDLAKRIELLADKVKQINDAKGMRNLYIQQNIQEIKESTRLGKAIETDALHVEEDRVVGFDVQAEQVVKLLTQGAESFEVITIVGMFGLGKTTLAKKVYNDPGVDYEFMIKAFVHVSRDYNKKVVLLKILGSFSSITDEVRNMNKDELEIFINRELKGKQYFFVLDDVWEARDWERLKDVFPNNNKRSRILITTRHQRVAMQANPRNPDSLIRLDFLTRQHSLELLNWRIFHGNSCPSELREYEAEIALRCRGWPLAIVLIAGILMNNLGNIFWWRDVAHSVNSYWARYESNKVIELMYEHLPNHLKPCFLYLGVFPEDLEIPAWKLLRLWISEGFIERGRDLGLEDLAESYLVELVKRSLVMVGERRSNGRIKYCRVHGSLLEFCKSKAGEENLYEEIDKDRILFSSEDHLRMDHCRRLFSINTDIFMEYMKGNPSGKSVRSLLAFFKKETIMEARLASSLPKAFASSLPKAFKLLRVMEAESVLFNRFPLELAHLVRLKYLAISSSFTTIPSSFSALWNLQTLIVKTTCPTLNVKADIWNMPDFRHFHTNASATLPIPKYHKSKEEISLFNTIQTLCKVSPEICVTEVFDRTPELKKLGISGKLEKLLQGSSGFSLLEHLHKLKYLENLKLLNDDPGFHSLPLKDLPRNLTKLTLENTYLQWKDMSILGELQNLEILKLREFAFRGSSWSTEKGGFLRLRHLYIGHTDLVAWEATADDFPMLRNLELNGCNMVQAIPPGFKDLRTLQSIVLHCTNSLVASSARRLQKFIVEARKENNIKLSVYPPDH